MAKVKVPSLTLTLDQISSSTLFAQWGAPGKNSGRWQKQIKNGKKQKKVVDALAGYTITWTVEYPTYYTNSKGARVSRAVSIKENSSDVGAGVTSTSFSIPENASKISVTVKPKSKTYKNKKKKDKPYFTGVAVSRSWDPAGTPMAKAPTPSATIENGKLHLTVSGLPNIVDRATFQIVRNNNAVWKTAANIVVKSGYCSYEVTVDPGYTYKARVQVKGPGYPLSGWSDYSENIDSAPKALTELNVRATSSNSVNVSWPSGGNDVQYELQWMSKPKVDNPENFDTTSTVSSQTCDTNEWNISGLEAGTWYFRIRVVKGNAKSDWYPMKDTDVHVTLGKPPSPPTTYTLVSSIKVGETINFYWVHNSEDGAAQMYGEVEFIFKLSEAESIVQRRLEQNSSYGMPDASEDNLYISLDTSNTYAGTDVDGNPFEIDFTDGISIEWRVRTIGPTDDWSEESTDWSDWSVVRQVDIWAEPYLNMLATSVLDGWVWDPFNFPNDTIYTAARLPLQRADDDIFTTLPVGVRLDSGPARQTPIGYSITITAKDGYTYTNEFAETVNVNAGEIIYSKFLTTDRHTLIHTLTPFNISFQDGETYIIRASVTMNSGLTSPVEEYEFTVDWGEVDMYPDADITIDPIELYATIVPYCTNSAIGYDIPEDAEDGDDIPDGAEDDDSNLVENVLLSVYRIDVDGGLTEIFSGLPNDKMTSVVDPHPTLGDVSYRIVAYKTDTGQITYDDIGPEEVPQPGIVISWNESWFNTPEEMNYDDGNEEDAEMQEMEYSGLQLKLPFNVDISESRAPDASLIQYIGRKRPVGYYGTQLGETATWKTEIPKFVSQSDYGENGDYWTALMPKPDEVLRLLRRLAIYPGDVYVRESSGRTGYWANVTTSFDVNHNSKTIPITFNITRVEGGA